MNAPQFSLTHVYDDGTYEVELYPVVGLSTETAMDRRDFLGVFGKGLSLAGLLATIPAPAEAAAKKSGKGSGACSNAYAHTGPVLSLAIAGDDATLFSGGEDGVIKSWSLPEGGYLETLGWPQGEVLALAVSRDGKTLAAGNQTGEIVLWNVDDHVERQRLRGHFGKIHALVFSPDGGKLASGSADGAIKLWTLPAGEPVKTLQDHTGRVTALAFTPDGAMLVSGGSDDAIRLWRLTGDASPKTLASAEGDVHALAITPDGRTLVVADEGPELSLRRLPDGEAIGSLQGHKDSVLALAIDRDGTTLVSGGKDETVRVWNLSDQSLRKTLKPHRGPVNALAITPDGDFLVSGGEDKTLKLWNLPAGTAVLCLMDLAASPPTTKGVTIRHQGHTRRKTHSWTQPCGSPIPAGAVCVCNCVPGSWRADPEALDAPPARKKAPAKKRKTRTRIHHKHQACGMRIPAGYTCTCNCVPVCQAHRLRHPDPVVRDMAGQLLFLMGARERDYLRWAAREAEPALADRIRRVMAAIGRNQQPHPARWPKVSECVKRLADADEIVAIMAAQMLDRLGVKARALKPAIRRDIQRLLDNASERPWHVRYGVHRQTTFPHRDLPLPGRRGDKDKRAGKDPLPLPGEGRGEGISKESRPAQPPGSMGA